MCSIFMWKLASSKVDVSCLEKTKRVDCAKHREKVASKRFEWLTAAHTIVRKIQFCWVGRISEREIKRNEIANQHFVLHANEWMRCNAFSLRLWIPFDIAYLPRSVGDSIYLVTRHSSVSNKTKMPKAGPYYLYMLDFKRDEENRLGRSLNLVNNYLCKFSFVFVVI